MTVGACWFLKDAKKQKASGVTVMTPDTLASQLHATRPGRSYVLQRHVYSPLLLDGHKFEIRFYMLVAHGAGDALRAFVLRDGVITTSMEPYEALKATEVSQITNSNKQRSLGHWDQSRWRRLGSECFTDKWTELLDDACECIGKVLGCCRLGGPDPKQPSTRQLQSFGVDMMVV